MLNTGIHALTKSLIFRFDVYKFMKYSSKKKNPTESSFPRVITRESLFKKFFCYLFILRDREVQREREREREPKQALHCQQGARCGAQTQEL